MCPGGFGFFFFKQKTAYEMRISDWSSDVCSSDLIYRKMRACPQPIIALGHGAAAGGGLSLLLASDVRYAAPSFRCNAAYIRIGLGGCDMASSYFLPRLVGASLAAEVILTGRDRKSTRLNSSH